MLRFSWAQLDAKRDIVIQVLYAAHGAQPYSRRHRAVVRARLRPFTQLAALRRCRAPLLAETQHGSESPLNSLRCGAAVHR